ncbi:MAG: type I-E CRISPR-associated protein Cse1/CasA [Clostridia bacterium]|nr:type I-E CRISPR-associated protein Cse1/CasA [Clostridia bacterium]
MADMEFNLLKEPWIRVMKEDCSVEEVSLAEALINAHEYRELAGELSTQNAAVLRLFLAVLHAVFERVDIDGEECEIENADNALDRWESLWKNKRFPAEPLKKYFAEQKDNFWLFHPTRPFWQIPESITGTEYEASKLNGCLSESSNKVRLFSERSGKEKNHLTFPEAARWLLYVNGFDDTSAKPTKEGKAKNDGKLPSPGAGWLGKIGYICIVGDNLFETLMLNFVLIDDKGSPWTSSIPSWELKTPRSKERTQIPLPSDQAALLTLQSRRLLLHREDEYVTGYHLLGGDFFEKENAISEQMTVWSAIKDKKGDTVGFQPRRHDRARQMWRDFAFYASADLNSSKTGIIRWTATLQRYNILPKHKLLRLSIASVQYGDKDFFAVDAFSDELSLHLNLFSAVGEAYRTRITKEIERCDKIAAYIGYLANNLFYAAGGDIKKKSLPFNTAKEQYYYEIDVPFRKWLSGLDAEDENKDEKVKVWRKEAEKTAYRLAEKMVKDAGPAAFVGKMIKTGKNQEKEEYCSTSTAMQRFKYSMKKLEEVR